MIFAGKSADSYAGGVQGMQRSFAGGLWGCGFLESAQSGKSLCGIGVAGVDPQDFPVKPLCLGGSAGLDTQFCQLDAGMKMPGINLHSLAEELLRLRFFTGLLGQEPAQLGVGMEIFGIDPNGFPQELLCLRFSAGLLGQEPAHLGVGMEVFGIDPNGFPQKLLRL